MRHFDFTYFPDRRNFYFVHVGLLFLSLVSLIPPDTDTNTRFRPQAFDFEFKEEHITL